MESIELRCGLLSSGWIAKNYCANKYFIAHLRPITVRFIATIRIFVTEPYKTCINRDAQKTPLGRRMEPQPLRKIE